MMTGMLTAVTYEQTLEQLHSLEVRLLELDRHTDLDLNQLAAMRRQCRTRIREFQHDIRAYEAELEEQHQLEAVAS